MMMFVMCKCFVVIGKGMMMGWVGVIVCGFVVLIVLFVVLWIVFDLCVWWGVVFGSDVVLFVYVFLFDFNLLCVVVVFVVGGCFGIVGVLF